MTQIILDIETLPGDESLREEIAETIKAPATMSKSETIEAWHNGEGKYAGEKNRLIDEQFRKTSFDGAVGRIAVIGFATMGGEPVVIADDDEKNLLEMFFEQVMLNCQQKMHFSEPFFIGHNISNFDLKFIFHRCVVNNVKPPFKLHNNGRHGTDFYDTMIGWSGHSRDKWISMDKLCKALGIEGKGDMDGSMVYDEWMAGNAGKVAAYCADDVRKTRQIYQRMTFGG